MPDGIRKAVAIQRDMLAGGEHVTEIHKLVSAYVAADLYGGGSAKTIDKLRKRLLRKIQDDLFPKARKIGKASATPLLDGINTNLAKQGKRRRSASVHSFLKGKTHANINVVETEIEQAVGNFKAATKVEFAKARRSNSTRTELLAKLRKADADEMRSLKEGYKLQDEAAGKLKAAERKLATDPGNTRAQEQHKAARKEHQSAKRKTKGRLSLFARFENAIQSSVRDGMRREGNAAQEAAFRAAGFGSTTTYMWVAVNGTDACPSCSDLHGSTYTLKQWGSSGKPGEADTYCGTSCMCQLVPDEYTKNNPGLTQPIKYPA